MYKKHNFAPTQSNTCFFTYIYITTMFNDYITSTVIAVLGLCPLSASYMSIVVD